MPSYFETLMRHHAWANQRLLDTAALLSPEQLRTGSLSQGTLFATLRHVADVNQAWGRAAQGKPRYDVNQVEHDLVDLPTLRTFWLAEDAQLIAFASSLSPTDLDRDMQPCRKNAPTKSGRSSSTSPITAWTTATSSAGT